MGLCRDIVERVTGQGQDSVGTVWGLCRDKEGIVLQNVQTLLGQCEDCAGTLL